MAVPHIIALAALVTLAQYRPPLGPYPRRPATRLRAARPATRLTRHDNSRPHADHPLGAAARLETVR